MANQLGVFWTVLPDSVQRLLVGGTTPTGDGGSGGEVIGPIENEGGPPPIPIQTDVYRVRFSATVAFRLLRGDGTTTPTTLAAFPDLTDWPELVKDMTFGLRLSTAPTDYVAAPTLLSDPSTPTWQRLFPSTLAVTPQPPNSYDARDRRKIRSYPRREIGSLIRKVHAGSQFAASGGEADPVIRRPIPSTILSTNFSPLTRFRTARLSITQQIENALSLDAGLPETWSLTRQQSTQLFSGVDLLASDVAQLNKYYRRLDDTSGDRDATPRPAFPQQDFHQLAALAMLQPVVARQLGLILDFTVDVPVDFGGNGEMQLVADYNLRALDRADVFYRTAYTLTDNAFEVRAQSTTLDTVGRFLRLGDSTQFDFEDGVDIDSAALKAVDAESEYAPSPAPTDLPALRTTGIAVNRVDAGRKLGDQRLRDRVRFNSAFGSQADQKVTLSPSARVTTPVFVNYAEDLIRGFRFDVYDETTGRWYSLHRRSGEYVVGSGADPIVIAVEQDDPYGEGFVSIVPLRPRKVAVPQATPPDEYYLSEAVMRWGGWSLSVPRVGVPITNDDLVLPRRNGAPAYERPASAAGEVVTNLNKAHGLPRLRFGRTYRLRARVVDVAGNSTPFVRDTDPEDLGDTVSPPITFHRYDPVESPTLVLRAAPTPGEGVYELVVRSEDATEFSRGISQRLVPPPATSQWMAECHGMFDAAIDGSRSAALNQYNALLVAREGKGWNDSPLHQPLPNRNDGEFFVPVQPGDDRVDVPYLPDPAATRARVHNLPGTAAAQWLAFGNDAWPARTAAKLVLSKQNAVVGAGSFIPLDEDGDTLEVSLTKGDVRTIEISSAMTPELARLFGLLNWTIDTARESNPQLSSSFIALSRKLVAEGAHRAISPPQEVRLVHAVRKPLAAPNFEARGSTTSPLILQIGRTEGETTARATGELGYSPRSTGRLDVRAAWNDIVDQGPGGPHPLTPIPRGTSVYSVELDRNDVPAGLETDHAATPIGSNRAVHEIGDTRHHKVTYFPKATSAFLQYFREEVLVAFTSETMPLTGGDALSDAPVTVVGAATGDQYKHNVDYRIDRTAGTITRLRPRGTPTINERVTVSFIRGVIDWEGAGVVRDVLATERPDPPVVHSLVPTFRWNRQVHSTRTSSPQVQSTRSGGGLRVWLERPWWSSGEDERLGVVVAPSDSLGVAADTDQFVSTSGTDAMSDSRNSLRLLRATNFQAGEAPQKVSLAENGRVMEVVPYPVQFDAARDQYFVDIVVNPSVGSSTPGYFPFVRLALVRYQPFAVVHAAPARPPIGTGTLNQAQTLSLSSVVMTDFIQVAPQRDVWVTRSGLRLSVAVRGDSYVRLQDEADLFPKPAGRGPTEVVVSLQRRDPAISDPELAWVPLLGSDPLGVLGRAATTSLTPQPIGDRYTFNWTGTVQLPGAGLRGTVDLSQYRLLVEEFETHYSDADGRQAGLPVIDATAGGQVKVSAGADNQLPSGRRCVFQDMIPLTGL